MAPVLNHTNTTLAAVWFPSGYNFQAMESLKRASGTEPDQVDSPTVAPPAAGLALAYLD